ncbi:hypothetical protein AKJ09_01369 [Labilithrix luteola]|uniref:Uncharacterized protein n=1 Tax=Labilithrix luteola TaxID=1391654 RepID=A0A0K1PMF6_9BACT|nr:hypothetical protein AKJ09_01369 [Labilithrix luteola]
MNVAAPPSSAVSGGDAMLPWRAGGLDGWDGDDGSALLALALSAGLSSSTFPPQAASAMSPNAPTARRRAGLDPTRNLMCIG